jgi:hypothetical protein
MRFFFLHRMIRFQIDIRRHLPSPEMSFGPELASFTATPIRYLFFYRVSQLNQFLLERLFKDVSFDHLNLLTNHVFFVSVIFMN